eukprot:SM000101S09235  [mRNA]  locus=s101:20:3710:+ [translate_table: standard]
MTASPSHHPAFLCTHPPLPTHLASLLWQRCIVVHATNNLLVAGNVAYNSSGHCFVVEDGIETGNAFVGNLGISTRAVERVIPSGGPADGAGTPRSDDLASTFWLANPNNVLIGNVAAGAYEAGFWIQAQPAVSGLAYYLANASSIVPNRVPLGTFTGNVAHSSYIGFDTYPGMDPRDSSGLPVGANMTGFLAYKCGFYGLVPDAARRLVMDNATLVGNRHARYARYHQNGVQLGASACRRTLRFLLVMAAATCSRTHSLLVRTSNATFDFPYGGRREGGALPGQRPPPAGWMGVAFGTWTDPWDVGNLVTAMSFGGFPATRNDSAAFTFICNTGCSSGYQVTKAGNTVSMLRFAAGQRLVWAPALPPTMPRATYMSVFRDADGSLLGNTQRRGTGGAFVVSATSRLLLSPSCIAQPGWNSFHCSTCIRSVALVVTPPPITAHTFQVTRSDTNEVVPIVPLWPYNSIKWNQLAGVEYKVLLALAGGAPQPARISVSAPDSRGCQQNMLVKLAIVGLAGDYNPSKPCVVANRTNSWVSTFSKQCVSPMQQVWQLSLATGYPTFELKLDTNATLCLPASCP